MSNITIINSFIYNIRYGRISTMGRPLVHIKGYKKMVVLSGIEASTDGQSTGFKPGALVKTQ